ncbi:kinase-like domain-containing protein [Boeremia exigua]|uniref:kinase-like domain-containing protein n=1 Tax=Boeremia exigua TaxID=749465 RepID=UPI001E8DC7D8|nr:kinase-like domain-containing protein [Boeremia exigua]KAH6642459.1 kinase-like domain-containing protein [Boeremia exigua]
MSLAHSLKTIGRPISRDELFKYTNGRFLANEKKALDRRYLNFDIDQLCAVGASTGQQSPVRAIEKMEGGFSKALLLCKEDGSEIIAKMPFSIAGPSKYTTASEVAVLQYCKDAMDTNAVPVPKVLAWDSDPSNPVGAEYIMMEKAPGIQLFKIWAEMSDWDKLCIVQQLTKLEGQIARIRFPASGSLYLCESMGDNDTYVSLGRESDPSGQFCIGPSCERGWHPPGMTASLRSAFNPGPWPDLSSFGIALVEREIALLRQELTTATYSPPRGSFDEQMTVLEMTKRVMSALNEPTFIDRVSEPVLWHTDLHMGNIYVSEEDPAKIVSLIDWQSIVVSPSFIQARFPEFLPVNEDYALGTTEFPKLPQNYNEMDADSREYAEHKLKEAKLAKGWELSSGSENNRAYKVLRIPSFLRELFIRSGEVSEEGVIPLQACLIELSKTWNDLGFTNQCLVNFSEADMQRHEQQFKEYRSYHEVHELARKMLRTDVEGWITPQVDFAAKQQQNEELLREVMRRSDEYNKSPEEICKIWPYQENSQT